MSDQRSDTTRDQILRAAAHQFAQRPYYAVGLDDILAQAQLTKGAMYFHFRSKHALALAIVGFSNLALLPEVCVLEAEVNPLMVMAAGQGVAAVDALVCLQAEPRRPTP